MTKKTIFLLLVSIVLAGCTLPQSLSKIMSGSKNQPSPSPVEASPSPSPSPKEEVKETLLLEIDSPKNDAVVKSPSLSVKGTTAASAEVTVNEVETKADAKGKFSAGLTLEEGENEIVVTANDADGNFAEAELLVTYQLP